MLHHKADHGDAHPAAEAHEDGFATGFNQLHNISIETDGTHGEHNEKFAQGFQRIEGLNANPHVESDGSDYRS